MKYLKSLSFIGIFLIGVFVFSQIGNVKANPSYFITPTGTATATTSPSYLTAGTGTTTLSFDAWTGGSQAIDSAALLTQFTGSSTASILAIGFEYSQDGIDWYSDTFSRGATSTQTVNLNVPTSYSLSFASTTVGGLNGTSTITTRLIPVATPTRFVRAVYTIPSGASAGAFHGRFVGKRETSF